MTKIQQVSKSILQLQQSLSVLPATLDAVQEVYRQISTQNPTSTVTSTKDLSFKHLFETRGLQFPFEVEKMVLESCGIYRALLRKLIPKQTPSHLTPSFAPGTAGSTLAHFPLFPNFPHFNMRSLEILFCKELDTCGENYFNINCLF